ncbi:MAG: nucleotidyltransferase domain-containing protein [Holophagales bacterium]|nr:nucleotidyltransferase domain-containing protein [Holophagales bacterium]MYF96498.1 nucleotidyltransferase domain-containing protein [Holophagales bacterium]
MKRWPSAEVVLSSLEEWCATEVAHRDGLLGFGYFGSYARGDEAFGSDLDLIAIVEADDRPAMERARDWPTENLLVPADLLVYTVTEWKRLQAEGGRFVQTLNAEARWLVART